MPLHLKPISVIEADLGVQKGGPVHAFFTDTCAKAMDKYVPFDTGTLAETVVLENGYINRAHVTTDTITYAQNYASVVYFGVRNGKELNYQKDKHLLATSYWDKHMWTAEGESITRRIQRFMERGGK